MKEQLSKLILFNVGKGVINNCQKLLLKGEITVIETQKWYIMRFLGEDNEINLKTKKPEFLEWKWINHENITDKVVEFKLHVYEKIKKELNQLIYT